MHQELPFSWHSKAVKRTILLGLLGLVLFYVVVPNIHAFGLNSRTALPRHFGYYPLALVAFWLTFVCSGLSYRLLAIKRLKLAQLWLVEVASVPLNLLLPAGIGNIGVNYLFLRTKGHNRASSAVIVGINNLIGTLGNVSLLAVLLLSFGVNTKVIGIYTHHRDVLFAIGGAVVLLTLSVVWFLFSKIKFARHVRHNLSRSLVHYRGREDHLIGAYGCAVVQSAVTGLAFWLVLNAYGIHLPYPLAYLIYGLSVLIGAIIPTPGGLGGVEASMTAGIVAAHGADTGRALTAVLAYRIVSYWLPLLIGLIALGLVQKRRLIRWR